MRTRLRSVIETLVVLFVQTTGRGKRHPIYRHYVRVQAGIKAGQTRRLNKANAAYEKYLDSLHIVPGAVTVTFSDVRSQEACEE